MAARIGSICPSLRTIYLVVLSVLVSACLPWDECENCGQPQEALAELRTLGVTLTTNTFPFPDSIESNLISDVEYTLQEPIQYLESHRLNLIFSPPTDKSIALQATDNEWDEHPYAYSFSHFIEGEFRHIKPLLPFNYSVAPTTNLNSQYGPIKIDNFPSELILYGNHFLTAVSAIPTEATHIELWHRQQREDELTLVRRVALENLYGWRQYIEPYSEI